MLYYYHRSWRTKHYSQEPYYFLRKQQVLQSVAIRRFRANVPLDADFVFQVILDSPRTVLGRVQHAGGSWQPVSTTGRLLPKTRDRMTATHALLAHEKVEFKAPTKVSVGPIAMMESMRRESPHGTNILLVLVR